MRTKRIQTTHEGIVTHAYSLLSLVVPLQCLNVRCHHANVTLRLMNAVLRFVEWHPVNHLNTNYALWSAVMIMDGQ
jgi:hypothetical protein